MNKTRTSRVPQSKYEINLYMRCMGCARVFKPTNMILLYIYGYAVWKKNLKFLFNPKTGLGGYSFFCPSTLIFDTFCE